MSKTRKPTAKGIKAAELDLDMARMALDIEVLKQKLENLDRWRHKVMMEQMAYNMGQRIARALLDKGDKWDLGLIAKMETLLGVMLFEVTGETAPVEKKTTRKRRK